MSNHAPHNSDARQPQDINQWPLAIIADLSYASAVLRAWSQTPFVEYVRENSKDSYYREGDGDEDASGNRTAQVSRRARDERRVRRSGDRAQAVDPAEQTTCEDMNMFDVVLALWMRAAREAASERRPPGSDAADVAANKNKIQTWLQSIEE
jgi:isocitrate/isopropylmalate dehydrogenase